MVAIKDFEMPSCCAGCGFCVEDKYADMTCVLLGSEWEETDYNEDHRDENCPLVDIEEHKAGKWIEVWESQRDEFSGEYDEWREHKCSICDFQEMDADRFNFCPNCGTKMRGAEND